VRHDAEELAEHLRRLAPSAPGETVHLHAVARELGVRSVRLAELGFDGQTLWSGGRPDITIRSNMSPARRRFTLAHELCHVLLGHGGEQRRTSASDRVAPDAENAAALLARREERLCDSVAAALLMPQPVMKRFLESGMPTLPQLISFARRWEVSLDALTYRVAEVSNRPIVVVILDKEEQWRPRRSTGSVPAPILPTLSDEAIVHLDALEEDGQVELLLRFGDYAYQCAGSATTRSREPGRTTTVALTRFRRVHECDVDTGS
jgi:Zn-dependent peptidase ImmA (M78 family)